MNEKNKFEQVRDRLMNSKPLVAIALLGAVLIWGGSVVDGAHKIWRPVCRAAGWCKSDPSPVRGPTPAPPVIAKDGGRAEPRVEDSNPDTQRFLAARYGHAFGDGFDLGREDQVPWDAIPGEAKPAYFTLNDPCQREFPNNAIVAWAKTLSDGNLVRVDLLIKTEQISGEQKSFAEEDLDDPLLVERYRSECNIIFPKAADARRIDTEHVMRRISTFNVQDLRGDRSYGIVVSKHVDKILAAGAAPAAPAIVIPVAFYVPPRAPKSATTPAK